MTPEERAAFLEKDEVRIKAIKKISALGSEVVAQAQNCSGYLDVFRQFSHVILIFGWRGPQTFLAAS